VRYHYVRGIVLLEFDSRRQGQTDQNRPPSTRNLETSDVSGTID